MATDHKSSNRSPFQSKIFIVVPRENLLVVQEPLQLQPSPTERACFETDSQTASPEGSK